MWSHATAPAPYGLGLSSERFWAMTPREFQSIRNLWGEHQALFCSAHFIAKDLPFVAADFTQPGHRERRMKQAQLDSFEVIRENRRNAMGEVDHNALPEWAVWHLRKVN